MQYYNFRAGERESPKRWGGFLHNVCKISEGFVIERDVQGIRDLALSLTDEETGEIKKKKGDYSTRQGVCGVPITESDLTKSIQYGGDTKDSSSQGYQLTSPSRSDIYSQTEKTKTDKRRLQEISN